MNMRPRTHAHTRAPTPTPTPTREWFHDLEQLVLCSSHARLCPFSRTSADSLEAVGVCELPAQRDIVKGVYVLLRDAISAAAGASQLRGV